MQEKDPASSTEQRIEDRLGFLLEIEKLKRVMRKTMPPGLDRHENSAEHSWQVTLAALVLREHANADIDIDRVIRMLLVHDLGEIDAGDTIVYASQEPGVKEAELKGFKRVCSFLPAAQQEEFLALWMEFETGDSMEAHYARAIDRILPILHNLNSNGYAWQKHGISHDRVLEVNAHVGKGSEDIWQVIKARLDQAVKDGILKQ